MNKQQQLEYLKRELKRKLQEARELQELIDELKAQIQLSNEDIKRLSE
jgi:hypothetical protein